MQGRTANEHQSTLIKSKPMRRVKNEKWGGAPIGQNDPTTVPNAVLRGFFANLSVPSAVPSVRLGASCIAASLGRLKGRHSETACETWDLQSAAIPSERPSTGAERFRPHVRLSFVASTWPGRSGAVAAAFFFRGVATRWTGHVLAGVLAGLATSMSHSKTWRSWLRPRTARSGRWLAERGLRLPNMWPRGLLARWRTLLAPSASPAKSSSRA